MNVPAQNAFLKILEEPPAHVVFVLSTDTPVKLLKTTLSRCVLIKTTGSAMPELFTEEITNTDEYESDEDENHLLITDFLASIEKGNPAIARFMLTLEKLNKAQFSDFLFATRCEVVALLRNATINSVNISNKNLVLVDSLLLKANDFLDRNVNVGHISGYICANLLEIAEN
jgi:hypothetical protein